MLRRSANEIFEVMKRKKYCIFEQDDKNYNLNIIGIRADNIIPNKFDDIIYLLWKFRGKWNVKSFPITTDPGTYWLLNPIMIQGTAILKEGQYKGLWRLGLHKNQYEALVQASPCTVIRDNNRTNQLDLNGLEETGYFGINCHKAVSDGISKQVDKWSAGCQVFPSSNNFNIFMSIVKKSMNIWGEKVSYTLLSERDFK